MRRVLVWYLYSILSKKNHFIPSNALFARALSLPWVRHCSPGLISPVVIAYRWRTTTLFASGSPYTTGEPRTCSLAICFQVLKKTRPLVSEAAGQLTGVSCSSLGESDATVVATVATASLRRSSPSWSTTTCRTATRRRWRRVLGGWRCCGASGAWNRWRRRRRARAGGQRDGMRAGGCASRAAAAHGRGGRTAMRVRVRAGGRQCMRVAGSRACVCMRVRAGDCVRVPAGCRGGVRALGVLVSA